jgi:adenylate cyclase
VTETRKLATVLALDMVGYSRATERDDSASAEAIRKMRDLLTQVSAYHGGRIFSSAGDGFMLEFPTATSGLEAALAVVEACKGFNPPLQVRIGLHSGEVLVEADGDLLGHAVNIAARLQQRADPGEVVLSEDVRRSARGSLTDKLVSLGDVKLDKMSETMDIYAANAERRRLPAFLRGRRARFAAIGVGVLAAGALTAAWLLQPSRDVRTAVFALNAPAGDAELVTLARGVTTEIVDAMHQIGMETASPSETAVENGRSIAEHARSLGAAFSIDGDIVRDGETVRASVRVNDVQRRQTLWSQSFERESDRARELRLEAASVAIAVMECAVGARRDAPGLGPSALSMLLRSCELSLSRADYEEALRLVQQAAAVAPRSSFVQGRLAVAYWDLHWSGPQADNGLLVQADAAADAALRIDPANAGALVVKTDGLAYTTSRRGWEDGLLSALARAPNSAELNSYYAFFLATHGRLGEAVPYARRALARKPLSPGHLGSYALALAVVGADREALNLLSEAEARWSGDPDFWYQKFRIHLWYGSRTEAVRLLDEAPSIYRTADIQCYRRVATGLAANTDAGRRQAARAAHDCWQPYDRHVVLAEAGDIDAAFAEVERMLDECADGTAVVGVGRAQTSSQPCIIDISWRTMFYPMTAPMRRDPRFMPVMQRAGLVEYWMETNRWPDFCEDPSLPYDCRQEARRVSANAASSSGSRQ